MKKNRFMDHGTKPVICISAILIASFLLAGCTVEFSVNNAGTKEDAVAVSESGSNTSEDILNPAEAGEASESDITLRDAVASDTGLGEDATIGACINLLNVHDAKFMDIITRNCNVVTLENELKPDTMLAYDGNAFPNGNLHEEELDGKTITVPTLDHSGADAILDVIAKWNEDNPDRPIKVRGHVLVWHSQTPEWFFHKDYDIKADYVSADEMNVRLEWYIKSLFEYYTGESSKYKGMFYGWDVVNEAISDRTGTYRTDTEPGSDKLTDPLHSSKSSWWKVYGSNEFIINAFRYANKYAPADLKLYYNDYNECDSKKKKGIISLISEVRAAEGTRIDGFGMQGHYTVFSPTPEQIDTAAREYAEAAGSVMMTELDVKPSMLYNGTEEGLPEEFVRQGKYYATIYDTLKQLRKDGVNITGINFWGMSDAYTWLPGKHPLLFDEDYNKKPAYFAFTDPAFLENEGKDE